MIVKDTDKQLYRLTLGKDNDEIVIGDSANPDNFKPNIKVTKWNKECSLTIKYNKSFLSIPAISKDIFYNKDKISVSDAKEEFYILPFDEKTLKFGLIFKSKPISNIFTFQLEGWEDFDFFYQPPLANVNEDGSTWEDIGDGMCIRPAEVNGSYAIYHKTKKDHIIGQTNYEAGKFGHIYRPKFIDANGVSIWGNIEIVNENYTITIPQSFLDTAKYPITANDTFGSTTIGASEQLVANDQLRGSTYSSPANINTATKLTAGIHITNGTERVVKGVITLESAMTLVPNGITPVTIVSTNPVAMTDLASFTTPPALSASTDYWLGIITNNASTVFYFAYDSGGGVSHAHANNYLTPVNPTSPATGPNRYSIYATYSRNVRRPIFFGANM
jgi:hypothetical protein